MPADVHTAFAPQPRLLVTVTNGHSTRTVHVAGELDLATRDQLVSVSTGGADTNTVLDLRGITFMDCTGYGALVASRLALEAEGRTLAITGETGQPARLFGLIAELQRCRVRPGLNHRSGSRRR